MSARRPYQDVGDLLLTAREEFGAPGDGLSQEDAAHAIGVSVVTYGRWERGERRPNKAYAKPIAKALKLDRAVLEAAVARHEDAPARQPVPPELQDVFYEMRDRMERLEAMVSLLLNARAADLGVAVPDPGVAFELALAEGLLDRPGPDDAAPRPGTPAPSPGGRPTGTSVPAAAGGRRR